jgi:hypothetical protein
MTGALFDKVSGRFQGVVVATSKSGLVIRRPPVYRPSQSPSQKAAASRMRRAASVWNGLDQRQAEAWDAYAATIKLTNPLTGDRYSPSGINAFIALATKVLQVDSGATVPIVPPLGDYLGDTVTVEAVAGDAAVVFQASGPNSDGSVTELLLERLPNVRRKPTGRFVSAGFHQFVPGGLQVSVPVEPGAYVAGWRFVERATGRVCLAQSAGRIDV